MAGRPGKSIAQEAGWKATHVNSSVRTGKNDRENGAREARALIGDDQRTLQETTQRGSRAPAPTFTEQIRRTRVGGACLRLYGPPASRRPSPVQAGETPAVHNNLHSARIALFAAAIACRRSVRAVVVSDAAHRSTSRG